VRQRPAYRPPSLALLALVASAACFDTPPAAPASAGVLPPDVEPALPVVVVDVASAADATAPVAAGRAAGAAPSTASGGPGVSAAAVAAAAVVVGPPINLGNFGPCCAFPEDVNDRGEVVGSAPTAGKCPERSGDFRAFLWTEGAGLRNLGTLGGVSRATGVNVAGQVVGASVTPAGEQRAFLWEPGSGMRDLGTLRGGFSGASAINAAGQVVGTSGTAVGEERAFLWDAAAGMLDLGSLGGPSSEVADINDRGQVAGVALRPDGSAGPVLWDAAGGTRPIPERPGFLDTRAVAINNQGQVLVADRTEEFQFAGYVWEEGRPPEPIGPLPLGITHVEPADINDRGQVVGTAYGVFPNHLFQAFQWERGAGMIMLPPLPTDYAAFATALNESGHVVGLSYAPEGCDGDDIALERAVRWTVGPVQGRAPVVDRLAAAVLPPGNPTGLTGVWLRVRLTDPGDEGPWDWNIHWGEGAPTTLEDLERSGEFAFLRPTPFALPGRHRISVTATDPGGLTSVTAAVIVQ